MASWSVILFELFYMKDCLRFSGVVYGEMTKLFVSKIIHSLNLNLELITAQSQIESPLQISKFSN